LRTPGHRLAPDAVPRGTHRVTARLYADDGSVWAVDGEPVESTADVTVAEPQASASAPPTATRTAAPADAEADGDAGAGRARWRGRAARGRRRQRQGRGTAGRGGSGGHGSPERADEASCGPCPIRQRSGVRPCSGAAPNG